MNTKALAAGIAAAGALCVMQSAEASTLSLHSGAGVALSASESATQTGSAQAYRTTLASVRTPSCTIEVRIGQNGRPTSARVLSCTDPGLRREAHAAAMHRRFTPTSDGPYRRTVRIAFSPRSA